MTAVQLNRLLDIAERLVVVMEKRLELEFPPQGEPVDAQVVRVGEGNADQPESKDEYEEFPSNQPSSFEQILTRIKEGS